MTKTKAHAFVEGVDERRNIESEKTRKKKERVKKIGKESEKKRWLVTNKGGPYDKLIGKKNWQKKLD